MLSFKLNIIKKFWGFVLDYFSELSNLFFSMHEKDVLMSLLSAPLVPSGDNKPCHLNKQQKSDKKALLVTQELKEILIGLLLGDLYAVGSCSINLKSWCYSSQV